MEQNEKDRMVIEFEFMEETGVFPEAADSDDKEVKRSPAYFKSALLAVKKAIGVTGWRPKMGTD